MTEKYKVTVNDLYFELKKLVENGDGDKPVKLSVAWDNCDHLQSFCQDVFSKRDVLSSSVSSFQITSLFP